MTELPKACPEQNDKVDDFLRARGQVCRLLDEGCDGIVQLRMLTASGQPRDASTGNALRLECMVPEKFELLDLSLPRLQKLLQTSQDRGVPRSATVGRASKLLESQAQYQDLRALKRRVDEAKREFAGLRLGTTVCDSCTSQHRYFSDMGCAETGATHTDATPSNMTTWRVLTAQDQHAFNEMRRRDVEIDDQLAQVGGTVDRLTLLARQTGASAARQKAKAERCLVDADNAQLEISTLNARIRRQLQR
jgi:hypothetical protein